MANETSIAEPYVGPRPFEQSEEDSARFFGRSRETQEIVSLIFGHPITLVYAQSGAGKTSLFNASITPALRREGFDVLPPTRVGGIIPKGIAPNEIGNLYLFNALLKIEPQASPQGFLKKSLTDYLSTRPQADSEEGSRLPRVMIFDQFEELFTYTPENWREQRDGFFLQIVQALEADPLLRIVFVIREDFLAQLDPYSRNLPERLRTRYRLERLQEDAALHAIKDPLVNTTRSFAPGVAEGLVKELLFTRTVDSAGKMAEIVGQYVEPVQLQVVCVTLWSDLEPETTLITQEHLQNFNVNIALSDFYETAIQTTIKETGVDEMILRDWFGKTLITPMGTRSTVFRGEHITGGIPNAAVDYLEGRHIIRAEFRAGVRWYELTHDRFIESILTNNKEWHAKRRQAVGNPLTESARDWQRLERDEGSLLRGAFLDEMKKWAEEHPNELDELEREFLEASKVHYQRELEIKAKSEKRLRALVIGLGVALVFAVVAIFTALNQATYANEQANFASTQQAIAEAAADEAGIQRARAQTEAIRAAEQATAAKEAEADARSGQLALQALSSLKTDTQLSLLLAIEANNISRTVEADDTLRQALEASQSKAILSHRGNVSALAFSPDGSLLVTGTSNHVITLWDVANWTIINEWSGDEAVGINFVAFAPDGLGFVTAQSNGSVSLWPLAVFLDTGFNNLETPYLPLAGLTASVTALGFSPDGSKVIASCAEGLTLVWDVAKLDILLSLSGHSAQVNSAVFSPAGNRIATASLDGTAILWDAETGAKLATLSGHNASVNVVAFDPAGRLLATASADSTIRLWDADTGRELTLLAGQTSGITSMAFSPDGNFLASAGDNNALIWEISKGGSFGEIKTPLNGHADRINSLAFSPDGDFLATSSADGTARVWGIPGGESISVLRGHTSSVNALVFDPGGTMLATASSDNNVRLWDPDAGNADKTLALTGTIWDLAFNPDGSLLASKGGGGTTLWDFNNAIDPRGPAETGTLLLQEGLEGFGVRFNSDGSLLASSGPDTESEEGSGRVTVFDMNKTAGENVVWSKLLEGEVAFALAFAPESDILAVSAGNPNSGGGHIRLWDISEDREVGQIATNLGGIGFGLAFSPDGILMATSTYNDSSAGPIRIWKVEDILAGGSNGQIVNLYDKGGSIQLVFSPDGKFLASGGIDGSVRMWDLAQVMEAGNPPEAITLPGQEGVIIGLAISPDGRFIAATDENGLIRIWDVEKAIRNGGTNAEVLTLDEMGTTYSVAFSPDGNWLVTGNDSGYLRISPINATKLIDLACSRLSRNLTQPEWDSYLGREVDYRPTCPNLPYDQTVLDAMVEKGRRLARQEKVDEAIALWNRVNDLDPAVPVDTDVLLAEIFVDKAFDYVQAADYDQALDVLKKALELDPALDFKPENKIAELLRKAAVQFALAGNHEQAIQYLRSVFVFDPGIRYKLTIGETVEGEVKDESGDPWIFEAQAGQTISVQLNNNAISLDPFLTVISPSGEVSSNDDTNGINSQIDLEVKENGTYIIVAGGFAGTAGTYTLTVTTVP